jgi:hypothetical protein
MTPLANVRAPGQFSPIPGVGQAYSDEVRRANTSTCGGRDLPGAVDKSVTCSGVRSLTCLTDMMSFGNARWWSVLNAFL